jgi:hypothetical protein
LVIVVLAVVVLPFVDTVVVALVLPDFVVTVFVEAGLLLDCAIAGVAIRAAAARDAISFLICFLLLLPARMRRPMVPLFRAASQPRGTNVKCRSYAANPGSAQGFMRRRSAARLVAG